MTIGGRVNPGADYVQDTAAGMEPPGIAEDEASMKRNRRAYLLTGFATGPDTGVGPLWISVLLLVMARDEKCDEASGAPDESCTLEDDWNTTHWDLSGGGACKTDGNWLVPDKYTHDASLEGCGEALAAYRAYTGYTCNCTGDYSFLEGGVRTTTVVTMSFAVQALLAFVVAPLVGVYLDGHRRKPMFYGAIAATLVSMLMMTVLAPNNAWAVSLVGSIVSFVTAGWVVAIVRQSYLSLTAPTDEERAAVSARRLGLSYAGNLTFVLVTLVVGVLLGDSFGGQQAAGAFACALCALWWTSLYCVAVRLFDEVEPPAAARGGGGGGAGGAGGAGGGGGGAGGAGGACGRAFGELWSTLKGMRSNPEALKYLLATFLMQTGFGGSFLVIMPQYLTVQLDFTSFQTLVTVAIILVMGIPNTALIVFLLRRNVAIKKLLLADICVFTLITLIIPVFLNEPGDATTVMVWIIGGCCASLAFALYYALLWPAMLTLTPECKIGTYSALHAQVALLGIIVGPLVAGGVGQATNNQQYSMLTLPPWNVLALVTVALTDFGKGKELAQALQAKLATDDAAARGLEGKQMA